MSRIDHRTAAGAYTGGACVQLQVLPTLPRAMIFSGVIVDAALAVAENDADGQAKLFANDKLLFSYDLTGIKQQVFSNLHPKNWELNRLDKNSLVRLTVPKGCQAFMEIMVNPQ